ncbi:MAG: glycosyltransferase family 2 protein [Chloroflexi bacterium]|nr:MAG: glycosyltransferase family 2 protein [Chloroflexota bacterium]
MKNKTSVGVIIPAFNEAKGIATVLEVLRQVESIDEIIIVNDGSTDNTLEIVRQSEKLDSRIRVISHEKNLGKGYAFFTAKAATQAPYLLALDADLIGLKPCHVELLIQPVLDGQADMTLGIFHGGKWNTDLSHHMTPWLTGQRFFRSDIINHLSSEAAAGYGIETALTIASRRLGWRVLEIPWLGVSHPPSEVHRGFFPGLYNRMKMYAHIVRTLLITLGWRQAISFVKGWKSTI